MKILAIDDEQISIDIIKCITSRNKILLDYAMSGEEGVEMALSYSYDVILVDFMMPGITGYEVVEKIRCAKVTTPIILVSALSSSKYIIDSLNIGADDYITKPFNNEILISKVNAMAKRDVHKPYLLLSTEHGLTLDLRRKEITFEGQRISLAGKEYKILELLIRKKGYVVSRDEILDSIYSASETPDPTSLNTYIYRARKVIERYTGNSNIIRAVYGEGYSLDDATMN